MEQYPAQRVGGAECAILSLSFLSGLSFSPLPVSLPFCITMSQVRAQGAKKVDEKQCKKLYTKTSPLIANCQWSGWPYSLINHIKHLNKTLKKLWEPDVSINS